MLKLNIRSVELKPNDQNKHISDGDSKEYSVNVHKSAYPSHDNYRTKWAKIKKKDKKFELKFQELLMISYQNEIVDPILGIKIMFRTSEEEEVKSIGSILLTIDELQSKKVKIYKFNPKEKYL